jgi:hypothetical protein
MDPSSPEFVAGRVVAVFALERFIHERTSLIWWATAVIAALLWIGAVMSDGFGAVIVALFALVATSVAATLFTVRAVVVRGIRRVGGGRNYERLRPIVAKRFDAVQSARGAIPVDKIGLLRLAWIARRPKALRDHLREIADTMMRTAPEVVADVRRELEQSPIDI